ncbi:Nif3-like dinuclear metal center hexameric protein [Aneurinibacillus sp. BA2021]|nr:Nif3-like dinuclear metal center hexameric protein [Aneurinibacillus sp. BA2021]
MTTVQDVVKALDCITGGRVLGSSIEGKHEKQPYRMMKSSGLPGKSVMETPGLVYGDAEWPVKRLAVAMTMSEQDIELAQGMGVDAIIAHHPLADAASSGGVTLRNYLDLYGIAALELHEAFHGLHPGIPALHGHKVHHVDTHFGGIEGNVLYAGTALPEVKTLGDILLRLSRYMGYRHEAALLANEQKLCGSPLLQESGQAMRAMLVLGQKETPVSNVLHIFPHTGFTAEHLQQAVALFPKTDTVIASISRLRPGHPLIHTARELGLNLVFGNSHALEIFENGLPLAYALDALLPDVEVLVFRERVVAFPLDAIGCPEIRAYGQEMALSHLMKKIPV